MRISDWSSDVCSSDLPRDVGAEARFQGFEIHPACLGCRNVLDREAREGRGRGIGAVRAFWDEDHSAVLAARFERRLDAENAAEFAMRARLGRHRDAVHTGELDQPFGELVDHRIRSEEHTSELQSLMRISYAVF